MLPYSYSIFEALSDYIKRQKPKNLIEFVHDKIETEIENKTETYSISMPEPSLREFIVEPAKISRPREPEPA